MGRRGFLSWLAASALIALHVALALDGATRHSAVFDEVVYPTSGYAYLTTGDYRMNPEHPPLLKLLTGAAWLGSGLDARATPGWEERHEWLFGRSMIYGAGRHDELLMRARVPIALLSAALALAIFLVAWRLAGAVAAYAALCLYALDPLAIAHAGYATTDLGGAAFYFLASVSLPGAFQAKERRFAVLAGLALGAALASKFSNLPLLAVALVAGTSAALRGAREAALRAAVVLAVAASVLLLTYGPAGPGSYLVGLRVLGLHNEIGHPTFAFGRYATTGWWWYFPAAWAVKTPIPILLATLGGVPFLVRRVPRDATRWAALLLAPALVVGLAMTSGLNIGVRHLLPATPFFALAGGVLAAEAWPRGLAARAPLGALALWLLIGTLLVHPDETAYANEAAGGPRRLWTLLSDSNVDWGQDLPALADAVGHAPLRRLYLGYFGTGEPRAYGIPYCWIAAMSMTDPRCEDGPAPDGREWVALSVTNLLDVYTRNHNAYAWLRERPFTAFPGHSIALFDITGDATAHRKLGESSLAFGEPAAAEAPLARAVELDARDRSARLLLASALAAQGRIADAANQCNAASALGASGDDMATCTEILAENRR